MREAVRGPRDPTRDVGRVLATFARAARARRLYRANNTVLRRLMIDLGSSLGALLAELGGLALRVGPDALTYEGETVLAEPDPDESIPFAFYRDGIRRLELLEGLDEAELEVLVTATADGFSSSGLGDDVVSHLWRHDLEHVRYTVVDTTIVDASTGASTAGVEVPDLDQQIDAILTRIYGPGGNDDVGPKSVRVDVNELTAKRIADTIDAVDELAPGFHPARALERPAYSAQLLAEREGEDEEALQTRAARAGLRALRVGLPEAETAELFDALLRLYDTALMSGALPAAGLLLRGVRELGAPELRERAGRWVEEAVVEARLRQVSTLLESAAGGEVIARVYELFKACGPAGVPAILTLLPSVQDPARRRALGAVAAHLGVEDLGHLEVLLAHEQPHVVIEAVRILEKLASRPEAGGAPAPSVAPRPGEDPAAAALRARPPASPVARRTGPTAAVELLARALQHPDPPVRRAVLEAAEHLPKDRGLALILQLAADRDAGLSVSAAEVMGRSRDPRVMAALEARLEDPAFASAPPAVKRAFLGAYAAIAQVKAVPLLARLLQDGGGLLAKKESEELAIAAAEALFELGTSGATAALGKAAGSLNLRVRRAAGDALKRLKERRS